MIDFEIALKRTLEFEGGYVNDPQDPGGETNFGITKSTAVLNGYVGPMNEIPENVVRDIYIRGYWIPLNCIQINLQELANHLFDAGVNQGTGQAARMLQKAVLASDQDDIEVDGVIGPKTIQATNLIIGMNQGDDLVSLFRDIRRGFYRNLVAEKPQMQKYLNGWLNRC